MVLGRWQLVAINALLLALVAYLAGATVGTFLTPPRPASNAADQPRSRAARSDLPGRDRSRYLVIDQRDLFHSRLQPTDALGHLRLVGTGTHRPSEYAVIEDTNTRVQRLYRTGDTITADSADETQVSLTLVGIERDRILLSRKGRTYALARGTDRRRPSDTTALAQRAPEREPPRPVVHRGRDDEYLIDRRDVQASLRNLNRVAKEIRAIPNFVGREPTGYRIFGIRANSIFARLGLRNGDVVRGVNTVALTGPEQALAVLRDLPRERRITLDVLRGHRERTLSYEVQ